MRKALYPGTFDPITFGHIDIIKRAAKLFDQIVVGVAHNYDKKPFFTAQERVQMLTRAIKGLKNVTIQDFDCLAVDFARKVKAKVIIRGIRMFSDFEYEFQMALTNRKLSLETETIFLMPSESYSYISSKLLKEIFSFGGDVSGFTPHFVKEMLIHKSNNK
ncbi:MAG: pantetheine-phosphate adenylyltransferase [Candidatus Omnitrophota bacterium]